MLDTHQAHCEMPRYQCHKKVWALKIADVQRVTPPPFSKPVCRGSITLGTGCGHCERCEWQRANQDGYMVTPIEDGYAPFKVTTDFVSKHKPEAGGYYVVYEDGYQSYSPAKAFEDGYTKL